MTEQPPDDSIIARYERAMVQQMTPIEDSDKAADTRECTCHPDDNPPRPCPRKFAYSECVKAAAAADYTEQARAVSQRWAEANYGPNAGPLLRLTEMIAAALSAVASERDAAAIRAFGQRVWSDTEEVAYQAGVSDTLARLHEPDVQKAVAEALADYTDTEYLAAASVLTKIAEMLK